MDSGHKEMLRQMSLNRPVSDEIRKNTSERFKDKPKSPEHRLNISKAKRLYKQERLTMIF